MFEHGKNYVCEKSLPTVAQPTPSCDFKSGQVILQQPIERAQMQKLLDSGKTDLLDKFVSMRTRRAFKAMLVWDASAGKVNFEFAPSKFPPRKSAAAPLTQAAITTTSVASSADGTGATGQKGLKPAASATAKPPAKKAAAKTTRSKVAAKDTPAKAARKAPAAGAGATPSAALAAVIGSAPVARPQVIKQLWDYIKAHNLQDAKDKRNINADSKLLAVFGKPQISMFELTGIVGKHLG